LCLRIYLEMLGKYCGTVGDMSDLFGEKYVFDLFYHLRTDSYCIFFNDF
jgi:hypothetical protein